MYAVIRNYSGPGAAELFELMGQREQEIRELISGVAGFVSYVALAGDGGGTTVTVCQGKDGTDESSRRAADWVKENLEATAGPPEITEGNTTLQF